MKKIIEHVLFLILLVIFIFLAWHKLGAFFCNQGNYYFQRQAYQKAISSYSNSIRVNPWAWMAHLGLAEAYRENKDYQASLREYKKALNINPLYSGVYDSLANIYYQIGDYEEALRVLADGQKANPADEKIKESYKNYCFVYLADALSRSTELFISRRGKEAILALENALSRCPGNAFAYYTLGYFYYANRNYDLAEMNLNKSVTYDPKFHYAYKLLSDIYLERKNIEKAVFFAREAVALGFNDASNYHHLGLLFMRMERYAEALIYLKKAVSLSPDNAEYIYSLGSTYRDNKMFKEAIAEYNKLSVLKNDYLNLHNDLADIYLHSGLLDQASAQYRKEIQYCQEKLKNSPDDPVLLNNYAHALNGIGQSNKALEITKALISAHPQYRQAYLTISRIYEKMNKYDLALKSAQEAKQLSSGENFIEDDISRLRRSSLFREKTDEGDDRIYLKNGRKLTGKIKKESPDKVALDVWLGSSQGELVFYRDAIERIERMKTEE